jgi:hypothetical protein
MRAWYWLGAVLLALAGCNEAPEDPAAAGPTSAQAAAPPEAGGGSGTIAPMGGVGAGPMTPVAGSESLQGGGSAAGQVMKDKAKGLANQAPSSLNQMGDE